MDAEELALALLELRERLADDPEAYDAAVEMLAQEAAGGEESGGAG